MPMPPPLQPGEQKSLPPETPGSGKDGGNNPSGAPKPEEKPQIDWKPDKVLLDSGEHVVRVSGPIKVDLHSITAGLDGLDYHVQWHPLDENGNISPHVRNPGSGPRLGGYAVPGVPKEDIYAPPYDNPHGWEVRVSIPPQPTYNDISAKPWLNVLVPGNKGRNR